MCISCEDLRQVQAGLGLGLYRARAGVAQYEVRLKERCRWGCQDTKGWQWVAMSMLLSKIILLSGVTKQNESERSSPTGQIVQLQIVHECPFHLWDRLHGRHVLSLVAYCLCAVPSSGPSGPMGRSLAKVFCPSSGLHSSLSCHGLQLLAKMLRMLS